MMLGKRKSRAAVKASLDIFNLSRRGISSQVIYMRGALVILYHLVKDTGKTTGTQKSIFPDTDYGRFYQVLISGPQRSVVLHLLNAYASTRI